MKLLLLIGTLNPEYGGPVFGCLSLAAALVDAGQEVAVVCPDDQGEEHVRELRDLKFDVIATGGAVGRFRYSSSLSAWFRKNVNAYDVVIVNGVWQYQTMLVSTVVKGSSTPYFVYAHGALDAWFREAYPLKHIKKSMYWALFERRFLLGARAVIFTAKDEESIARREFNFSGIESAVVQYGVEQPRFNRVDAIRAFREVLDLPEGTRILLFVSRVQRKKGLQLLVAAFDRVYAHDTDIRLVIVGPEEDATGQEIRDSRKNLRRDDKVIFTGMLSGLRKWGAYASAELFCLTSHSENFGLVIAEAAACGLPILTTNKVNIAEELSRFNAALVVNDDEQSVVQGLLKWQACPPSVRQAMADASLRCFAERFDMRLAARRLICLIEGPGTGKADDLLAL